MARLGLVAVAVIGISLGAWYLHSRIAPSAQPAVASAPASPAAISSTVSSAVAQPYTNTLAAQPQPGKIVAEPAPTLPQPTGVNSEGEPIRQASAPVAQTQPIQSAPPPQALLASAGGAATGELLLQINARSTVWLSVTADGEKKWQGTMQANQSREIAAADSIRLTVGNAGGVELTLNGKELGALGGEGEVKTITLAARALAEPVP
jgi:hypothetical protein